MTNRLALVLLTLILIGVAIDMGMYDGAHLLFLADKYDDFIEYLAFWR